MKLDDIKLGVSPLTDRIYLGTLVNPTTWHSKRDATSDVCRVILEWIEPGTIRTINSSNGDAYEIEVRKLPPKATPGGAA